MKIAAGLENKKNRVAYPANIKGARTALRNGGGQITLCQGV